MIKNKIYLPYSYYIFVIMQNNSGKELNEKSYDPHAYYCIQGTTALHEFANNFRFLEFMLKQFEKTNPQLINLLLLQN